jgi:hypothetical protein
MTASDFDRFTNPFASKLDLDTLLPNVHNKQVLYFCNEALELFGTKG